MMLKNIDRIHIQWAFNGWQVTVFYRGTSKVDYLNAENFADVPALVAQLPSQNEQTGEGETTR